MSERRRAGHGAMVSVGVLLPLEGGDGGLEDVCSPLQVSVRQYLLGTASEFSPESGRSVAAVRRIVERRAAARLLIGEVSC